MAPLESARSGALCELCKNPLDLEVNFCPWCGFPVQEKFEAGTPSPRDTLCTPHLSRRSKQSFPLSMSQHDPDG